jgi:hypothetical protein
MANTFLGVALKFGAADSVTIPGFTSFLLQDEEHGKEAKNDDVDDADGNTVQRTIYNPKETAKFSIVVKAATVAALDAILAQAGWIPAVGLIGTVSNAKDAAIAGTNWIVTKVDKKRSNTSKMMVSVDLERFPGITAVTS